MKLAIGTAFYEVKGYSPYIKSLFYAKQALDAAGIESLFIPRENDSYVDRAKNSLLSAFIFDTDCTHLLMWDSDMSVDLEGFANVIKAPFDFVGTTYPAKGMYEKFPCQYLQDEAGYPAHHDVETGLLEAVWVPGGFLKLSRRVVERMFSAYEALEYEVEDGRICVELFKTCVVNRGWQSEDVTFCNKWRALGEKIWLEPRVTFGHMGTKEWCGNFHEYLLNCPGGRNDKG